MLGELCGKYLAVFMAESLARLEAFGELAPTKAARYPAAKSAARPGATLWSSIQVRQTMDEIEAAPGLFEIDLVAHCGHTPGWCARVDVDRNGCVHWVDL